MYPACCYFYSTQIMYKKQNSHAHGHCSLNNASNVLIPHLFYKPTPPPSTPGRRSTRGALWRKPPHYWHWGFKKKRRRVYSRIRACYFTFVLRYAGSLNATGVLWTVSHHLQSSGLRNRIMNEVYDNEHMIGMEKKKCRRKGSGQLNESNAEFDSKSPEMQISEASWFASTHIWTFDIF